MQTSKIGSDHVTNVFSNSIEFDHHDSGSLIENPHNRVALMKKITDMDMEVEFHICITSIEDFLKIPRSPNLEKTSNVAAECIHRVDLMLRLEIKESMCIDSSVKTSCATDINANNVHNDSMDLDHDPRVVEQNEFDQNVVYKILIHDFDQTVEWKILLDDEVLEEPQLSGLNFVVEEHQQVSSKNCEVPLAGAKKIAVDALMKIINFDITRGCKSGETSKSIIFETQSHTCDYVEEANDAKVQREAKASKCRVSPYMIQPESTQQNHKVRARNKKDLFRPKHALKTRTIVPPEISDMLQDNKDKYFYFPWTNEGSFVCFEFWERLLGIGKESREWLSDMIYGCYICGIIDWKKLIGQFVVHFFNTFMLEDKMPYCYVDGVTYGVPLFSESIEKVYFLINAEDNHWILAEFHIRSGVITFL
nr:ulp1 protease family, C-terminal catalytic domain-containing protein [Tanacetum cinerariifolium]